jgi:hypothetical protein
MPHGHTAQVMWRCRKHVPHDTHTHHAHGLVLTCEVFPACAQAPASGTVVIAGRPLAAGEVPDQSTIRLSDYEEQA